MKRTMLALAVGLVFLGPQAIADGFNKELFESWLTMRTGDGKTDIYWYWEGLVKTFPEGVTTARMIGFDANYLLRDSNNTDKAIHLSRKIYFFFDPETGARLERDPIAYPFQVRTYELDGDEIIYTVESHNGTSVYTLGPMRNFSAKTIGRVQWLSYSVFNSRGAGRFESSDFYVQPGDGLTEQERYQMSWVSHRVGSSMSSAVAWRYSSFDAMPDHITRIVREEAPLWTTPPRSMDEIAPLREKVKTAKSN